MQNDSRNFHKASATPSPWTTALRIETGNPIEEATGAKCFFAHPYSSWERGTNENTNGLIRDYFPKKTDFTTITDEEIAYVERELNERPRKRLGWQSPLQAMGGALAG